MDEEPNHTTARKPCSYKSFKPKAKHIFSLRHSCYKPPTPMMNDCSGKRHPIRLLTHATDPQIRLGHFLTCPKPQSTYLPGVPQSLYCMFSRANWDPPLPLPPEPAEGGGTHSPAGERVGGIPVRTTGSQTQRKSSKWR
jgi:hypothetical protein